jgi:hypothetical protein
MGSFIGRLAAVLGFAPLSLVAVGAKWNRSLQSAGYAELGITRAIERSSPTKGASAQDVGVDHGYWTALGQKIAPPALVAAKVPQAAPISRPPA